MLKKPGSKPHDLAFWRFAVLSFLLHAVELFMSDIGRNLLPRPAEFE